MHRFSRFNRFAALAGVGALVKTGEALGVASAMSPGGSAVAGAAVCADGAHVQLSAPMPPDDGTNPNLPPYGTVSLWYSSACRSVAGQVSVPNPVPGIKLTTFVGVAKRNQDYYNAACTADPGTFGCKTNFVNDAGIQQAAFGGAGLANGTSFYGQTAFW
jgi:hypothetical protein